MSTQETSREKIRRADKVSVDMGIVEQLITYKDMRNCQLEGTKYFCNLYPDINKRACKDCPKTMRELCEDSKREREYIHAQDATKANPRRKRKQENPKKQILEISVRTTEEDDTYLYEEQTDPIAAKYPCEDMYFACPDKEKCQYGKECPYKPD